MSKIFCIGFHKTGTTSLDRALETLGYKVCGVRHDLVKPIETNNFQKIWKVVEKHDAFQDNPWPVIYKELDSQYPGSKFILTTRDDQKWLQSVINHFKSKPNRMRHMIYGKGAPMGFEDIYLDRYRTHNKEVRDFFKNRSSDLLEVSWEAGHGWNELCSFLDKPIPNEPFFHSNKGSYSLIQRLIKYPKAKLRLFYKRLKF